jgi:8-oxo-dGTP pyrophosphatase MutT (NUDIX family)
MIEKFTIPGAGGIIEKNENGVNYILIQERFKENAETENGLIEIPAGKTRAFENIYECLRREIQEETGLEVYEIEGEKDAVIYESNGYKVLSYSPFTSNQNVEGHYPIMVQTFICKAKGKLLSATNETMNLRWISLSELKVLLDKNDKDFYPMHVIALKNYIKLKMKQYC